MKNVQHGMIKATALSLLAASAVMAEGTIIRRRDLGIPETGTAAVTPAEAEESLLAARDVWMRTFLARALTRHSGRRAETARALGIGERTLFRYLEQYGIRDS